MANMSAGQRQRPPWTDRTIIATTLLQTIPSAVIQSGSVASNTETDEVSDMLPRWGGS